MPTEFSPRFDTLVGTLEHSSAEYSDRPLFGTKREGSWIWMTYRSFRDEVDRVRTGLVELASARVTSLD